MEVLSTAGSLVTSVVIIRAPRVPGRRRPCPHWMNGGCFKASPTTATRSSGPRTRRGKAPTSRCRPRSRAIDKVGISFWGVDVFSDPVVVRSVELLNAASNPLQLMEHAPAVTPARSISTPATFPDAVQPVRHAADPARAGRAAATSPSRHRGAGMEQVPGSQVLRRARPGVPAPGARSRWGTSRRDGCRPKARRCRCWMSAICSTRATTCT